MPCSMHHITPGETRSVTLSLLSLLMTSPGLTSARAGAIASAANATAPHRTASCLRAVMESSIGLIEDVRRLYAHRARCGADDGGIEIEVLPAQDDAWAHRRRRRGRLRQRRRRDRLDLDRRVEEHMPEDAAQHRAAGGADQRPPDP